MGPSNKIWIPAILLGAVCFGVLGSHSLRAETNWERKAWIAKGVRNLWGSSYALTPTELERLNSLSDAQIVNELVDSPRAADFVLRFNLLFLGFNPDQTKERFANEFFSQHLLNQAPGAFLSAKNFLQDGDYFSLFNMDQSLYLNPLPERGFPGGLSPEKLSEERFNNHAEIRRVFDETLFNLKASLPQVPENYCKNIAYLQDGPRAFKLLLPTAIGEEYSRNGFNVASLRVNCADTNYKVTQKFVEKFEEVKKRSFAVLDHLETFEFSKGYRVQGIADLKEFDHSLLKIKHRFFSSTLSYALPNNTGNFNRIRAKHVLSKFFCDELFVDVAPVHVELPKNFLLSNVRSPECMSCHFRLDPMAGFFKDLGYLFQSYLGQDIRLDDTRLTNKAEYDLAWKNPPGSPRPWEIGYRRAPGESSANSWGESLADFEKLLKTAPEVKTCLTKKLYLHLVGRKQLTDAAYIENLSSEFKGQSSDKSSRALKVIIKKILSSKAFRLQNPNSSLCYDRDVSQNPALLPPCEISDVLHRNCLSCHSSARGSIQFNMMLKDSMGKKVFRHLDEQGKQLSQKDSFARIIQRVQSVDSAEMMPPENRYMTFVDTKRLMEWLENEIQEKNESN